MTCISSGSLQLDSRITSLMVSGGRLWIAAGKGMVLVFTVSGAVAETEVAIVQLAQERSELAQLTEGKSCNGTGHGLLTAELAGDPHVSEPSTEPLEERSNKEYYRKRRTAFGRTLRGPSMKKIQQSPAVFLLKYESNYQLVQSESVRVLLSMQ